MAVLPCRAQGEGAGRGAPGDAVAECVLDERLEDEVGYERVARTVLDVGFTRAELESYRGATVPDLVGPGLRTLPQAVSVQPFASDATRRMLYTPGLMKVVAG